MTALTPPSLINEDDISQVVHAFYACVRQDELLAPIFATKIKAADWDSHMEHISKFWSSIFLKSNQFKGNPMQKHLALEGLTPEHFTRWLSLFQETSERILSAEKAGLMNKMAARIGQSLQMGLAFNYEKSGQKDHAFAEFGIRQSH